MPLVDRMSLLLYLLSSAVLSVRVGVGDRKAIRAVSDSEPGTGGMGCSSYHTEQKAVPQSQFQMLWTSLSQHKGPAQIYCEIFIAAGVDDSLGGPLPSLCS